jgi:hypothetical protein
MTNRVIVTSSFGCLKVYDCTIDNARLLLSSFESYGDYSVDSDPDMYVTNNIGNIISFIYERVSYTGSDVDFIEVVNVKSVVS